MATYQRVSYHRGRQAVAGMYEDIRDDLSYSILQQRAQPTNRTYAFLQGLESEVYDDVRLPEDFRRHSYDDIRSNPFSESYNDIRVPTKARSMQQFKLSPTQLVNKLKVYSILSRYQLPLRILTVNI